MFWCKTVEIFKNLLNVFDITDEILIVGYDADSKDYNRMLRWVMQIFHKESFN